MRPPDAWLAAFAAGASRRLCGFGGRDLAVIMWALPRVVGYRTLQRGHEGWLREKGRRDEEWQRRSSLLPLDQREHETSGGVAEGAGETNSWSE